MDWVEDFYTTTGRWWGSAESHITERDRARVKTIRRLAPQAKQILELGSGYGNTAAACAENGFEVVAVEISERVHFAKHFQGRTYRGALEVLHADFFDVQLKSTFDAVTYWNGFGVGTDADQRQLLTRIAREWLRDGGVALLDIANPFVWASWAGEEEHKPARPQDGYHYAVSQRIEFDPVHNRFLDTWWQTDRPETRTRQSVRCYAPADFALLLEGTGLELDHAEVQGQRIDLGRETGAVGPLSTAHEYIVRLRPR